MAAKIFLAHAREDMPQVRKLYADLKTRGFDPWLDKIDLIPGQNWEIEIPKAIRQAGIFLACLSTRSVGKVGYVQNEFRLALSAFGERPPGSIFLIPIRLDDCEVPDLQIPHLGLRLRAIHWVDLWEEDGFDYLVKAIEHAFRIATPSQASREPPPIPAFLGSSQSQLAQVRSALSEQEAEHEPQIQIEKLPNLLEGPSPIKVLVEAKLSAGGEPEPPEVFRDIDASWCPELVVIPPGEFMMGTSQAERIRSLETWDRPGKNETPQHKVQIAEPFALGKYEVTFDEWDACVKIGGFNGYKPRDVWGRGRQPVINVCWNDAKAYIGWLSELSRKPYRLPSEAEWEYACRTGTTTRYWWGDDLDDYVSKKANYARLVPRSTDVRRTAEVGSYPPNPWGLYDMHGNVWEWVEDCWNKSYRGAPEDGRTWSSGNCNLRVVRGGSFLNDTSNSSARRSKREPTYRSHNVGFRIARTLSRSES